LGDFEGKGKFWDNVAKRAIWGYKLYVIFAVESKLPPSHRRRGAQSEARFLDQLLEVYRLGFILFDKGFWKSDEFAKLEDEWEKLVTAAVLYKSVKKAIATTPQRERIRAQRNE
jgi:hypothetical protein